MRPVFRTQNFHAFFLDCNSNLLRNYKINLAESFDSRARVARSGRCFFCFSVLAKLELQVTACKTKNKDHWAAPLFNQGSSPIKCERACDRSSGARRRFPAPADAIGNVQAPLAQEVSVLTYAIRTLRASFGRSFPPRADYMAASTGAQQKSERIKQRSIAQVRAQPARERGEDAGVASTQA